MTQNQNIINFNLIITQNNVENIAHKNNIQNITNLNSINNNKALSAEPKKKAISKSKADGKVENKGDGKVENKGENKGESDNTKNIIKKKSNKSSDKDKSEKNDKNDKSSSKSKSKKKISSKSKSKNSVPKEESILTFLLGKSNTNPTNENNNNINTNKVNKGNNDNESSHKGENGNGKVPEVKKKKKKPNTKELEKNIIDQIENKPVANTFPNKFVSPINSEEVDTAKLEAEKVNTSFNNNNFYPVVYQNKEIVPEEIVTPIIRPTRFPVEDKVIYDDAVFYNLTSYHLNVFFNIIILIV